jgi:chitinase domain-containing protein 1
MKNIWQSLALILFVSSVCDSTLSKSDKKVKKKKSEKKEVELSGPLDQSVHSRKLVNKLIASPEEIIVNHAAYSSATSDRNFDSMDILGYVTPWNNHGYDVAKIFGPKFTLLSPVWLQVVPEGLGDYVIKGTHDIDKVYIL